MWVRFPLAAPFLLGDTMETIAEDNYMELKKVDNNKNYVIINKASKDVLGYINFFPRWHKFVFTPITSYVVVFDIKCLKTIENFIETASKQ